MSFQWSKPSKVEARETALRMGGVDAPEYRVLAL